MAFDWFRIMKNRYGTNVLWLFVVKGMNLLLLSLDTSLRKKTKSDLSSISTNSPYDLFVITPIVKA